MNILFWFLFVVSFGVVLSGSLFVRITIGLLSRRGQRMRFWVVARMDEPPFTQHFFVLYLFGVVALTILSGCLLGALSVLAVAMILFICSK